MERGREGCSIDLLVEIAVYFHVSTDYLLMGKASDLAADRKRILDVISELSGVAKLNCQD